LKKCKNKFEAHLMVKNPENWISQIKEKGFEKIIIHVESTKKLDEIIAKSKTESLILYFALNPETPTEKVFPYLSRIKGVLFMGVNPGKEHQKLLLEIYGKIKLLKSVNKAVRIQVDGGANEKNIARLAEVGVNYVNSGSLISDSENPRNEYKLLTKLFKENRKS
jgi:ribulose-phosphate 3-epimerase